MSAVYSMHPPVNAEQPSRSIDQRIQRLYPIWEAQRSEIQTARLKLKYLEYDRGALSHMSASDWDASLQDIENAFNVDGHSGIEREIAKLYSTHGRQASPLWYDVELLVDGRKVRDRRWKSGTLVRDIGFDGEREVHFAVDSSQANVFHGESNMVKLGLHDLRRVPQAFVIEGQVDVSETENTLIVLRSHHDTRAGPGQHKAVFNLPSGTVREWRSTIGGEVRGVESYFGISEFPGGISFPALAVNASFVAEHLAELYVSCVEDAQFNVAISDGEFKVPAPAGTAIVDLRDLNAVRGTTLTVPSNDVAMDGLQRLDTPVDDQGKPTWSVSVPSVIVINLAFLLFVIGVLLIRKARGDKSI